MSEEKCFWKECRQRFALQCAVSQNQILWPELPHFQASTGMPACLCMRVCVVPGEMCVNVCVLFGSIVDQFFKFFSSSLLATCGENRLNITTRCFFSFGPPPPPGLQDVCICAECLACLMHSSAYLLPNFVSASDVLWKVTSKLKINFKMFSISSFSFAFLTIYIFYVSVKALFGAEISNFFVVSILLTLSNILETFFGTTLNCTNNNWCSTLQFPP